MFGRLVLPIEFIVDRNTIMVSNIKELKEYYNSEHIPELLNALQDGKLEQFFFGNGRDDIKELIEQLKGVGADNFEILNAVAERIGVEKLNFDAYKEIKKVVYQKFSSISEILKHDSTLIELLQDEYEIYEIKEEELFIISSKEIIGLRNKKVVMNIEGLTLRGDRDFHLIFNNIKFHPSVNKIKASLKLNDCKISFIEVTFDGIELDINNSDVKFSNCNFKNGKVKIYNSMLFMENSKFENFENINIDNSEFEITKTEICKSGTSENDQLIIIKSNGKIIESRIYQSNKSGIVISRSHLTISNSYIFENKGYGIFTENQYNILIKDTMVYKNIWYGLNLKNSNFKIEDSEIYSNGTEDKDYPQILITESKGEIVNSKIYNGLYSGVSCKNKSFGKDKSFISINHTEIYENRGVGIEIINSNFNIDNSKIYSNDPDGKGYSQVEIDFSNGKISKSRIYGAIDGIGINCFRYSNVTFNESVIYRNGRAGIKFVKSKFDINECEMYYNGGEKGYFQIWIQKSKGEIKNSKIHKNKRGGVYCENQSTLSVYNTRIYENEENAIFILDSNFKIDQCEIYNNGIKGKNYPQIFINNSRGEISNSRIHKAIIYKTIGDGIYVKDSQIALYFVTTWDNKNGLLINKQNLLSCDKCNFKDGIKEPDKCLIATTVIVSLGRDYYCYELDLLRKYRDDYLLSNSEGKKMIEEYYKIAPQIVKVINVRGDRELIYKQIWKDFLKLCIKDIEKKRFEKAKKRYVNMVKFLKNKYLN